MKITDKIVTSRIQPTQTNVVWHNPDTGELKMFGEKGWEIVGGNLGESTGGGYPIVTIDKDFNIEAEPNTFYNIKSGVNDHVTITCKEGYSAESIGKHIMFTCDEAQTEELQESYSYFTHMGGVVVSDTSQEGYKYRMDFDMKHLSMGENSGTISAYFTNEIKSGNTIDCLFDISPLGQAPIQLSMSNIQILNENIDYLVWVGEESFSFPHIFIEVENDNPEYKHKYKIQGFAELQAGLTYLYAQEPYITAQSFYAEDGTEVVSALGTTVETKLNIEVSPSNIINEFVFNIKCPTNVIFNYPIFWNNNMAPDLTQEGIFTISLVNGVGCYTFV